MTRDLKYESQALEAMAAEAKCDGATARAFEHVVQKRLDHGSVEYGGDSAFASKTVDELIAECSEEGSDQAAWALLALQRLRDLSHTMPRDEVHTARVLLLRAASFGLLSWQACQMARDVVREAEGRPSYRHNRALDPKPFSDVDED